MERLIQYAVRRYLGGPGRAWLFTSAALFGYRKIKSTLGRKEVVEIRPVGKGRRVVIEHLPVTHQDQLRAEKVARKSAKKAKRAARAARRAQRREKRAARAAAAATP